MEKRTIKRKILTDDILDTSSLPFWRKHPGDWEGESQFNILQKISFP